jgi:hypothetical protein
MAKPITNRVKTSKTPVIRKDLDGGVIAEANNDGSIYVDKSVKKGSPLEKEAIAHEKVHLNQMNRGDLNYDDNNVYWKGKAYPRSSMNEGAKNLPWEKEAYDKTKHMKNKKKSAPTKMSDADIVAGNTQVHKKFTDAGGIINANTPGANTTNGITSDGTEGSVTIKDLIRNRKDKKNKERKEQIDDIMSGVESKSLDAGASTGPNAPTFINPLTMKATPITLKSRRGYDSPLNYNSPIKNTAAEEYKAIVNGKYGTVKRTENSTPGSTTNKSTSRKSNVTQAKEGQPQATDAMQHLKNLSSRFPGATGAELAAGKHISGAYVDKYDKMFPSSESSSETTTTEGTKSVDVEFTPDKITVKGKEATPGTYNMGFYEARNLNLAAKQKRQTQNRDLRQSQRDYYKALERKTGERVPRSQRQQINPTTGQPFDGPKEFMEYRSKARSSYDNKVGKRYGGTKATKDTIRDATADDAPEGTVKADMSTGLAVIENTANQQPVNMTEGSKVTQDKELKLQMKTPFKMGGFGSKNKNN